MTSAREKLLGQFFTPQEVASTLVSWTAPNSRTRVLDPSCGDGEFLRQVHGGVGIELCPENAARASDCAPDADVIVADFFDWAAGQGPRFDVIVGNPPFIRYQQFSGATRKNALRLSKRIGVEFSRLTSSWAPFLAVSASLLKPGGRMAFVVPAEIGHATYASPLIRGLCGHFSCVSVVAVREKLFPKLSQDAWLLYAGGKGGRTEEIGFTRLDHFTSEIDPLRPQRRVPVRLWSAMGERLRKFLIPGTTLDMYAEMTQSREVAPLGDLANVTIGYVSGDNDFFHFSKPAASMFEIPDRFLRPTIRRGEQLTTDYVDDHLVRRWLAANEQICVLDLSETDELPSPVRDYLQSPRAEEARARYKCRVRDPWYVIPGLDRVPSAFITCMSGRESRLAINRAGAVCTNSVLAVSLKGKLAQSELLRGWRHPLARLSQELEGHPLGGGMLKLEPGEARRVLVPTSQLRVGDAEERMLDEAVDMMRKWRHYAGDADRG